MNTINMAKIGLTHSYLCDILYISSRAKIASTKYNIHKNDDNGVSVT